jgi:hypothetical protein
VKLRVVGSAGLLAEGNRWQAPVFQGFQAKTQTVTLGREGSTSAAMHDASLPEKVRK